MGTYDPIADDQWEISGLQILQKRIRSPYIIGVTFMVPFIISFLPTKKVGGKRNIQKPKKCTGKIVLST